MFRMGHALDRESDLSSFRFMHAADLHLGSPFAGLAVKDAQVAEQFARATRDAFSSLVTEAIERAVAFVVIAGDVYDGEWRDNSIGLFFNREVARLDRAGIPVVLFNRTTERDAVSSVTTRNREGGRRIAEFLIAGGHRRFGYISGVESSSTNRDRFAGYREALAEAGHDDIVIGVGNYDRAEAEAAAREMFSRPDRPDALFVANDHMAVAVMDVARYEFGLSIPNDLSIVGYDDVGPARWASYGITSMSQPMKRMVEATVNILMGQISKGEIEAEHRILSGDLIVRTSARLPKTGVVEIDGRRIYKPGKS